MRAPWSALLVLGLLGSAYGANNEDASGDLQSVGGKVPLRARNDEASMVRVGGRRIRLLRRQTPAPAAGSSSSGADSDAAPQQPQQAPQPTAADQTTPTAAAFNAARLRRLVRRQTPAPAAGSSSSGADSDAAAPQPQAPQPTAADQTTPTAAAFNAARLRRLLRRQATPVANGSGSDSEAAAIPPRPTPSTTSTPQQRLRRGLLRRAPQNK
ncbi:hypothetical protein HK102_004031, partial [Quaeritorhiza haematococci]